MFLVKGERDLLVRLLWFIWIKAEQSLHPRPFFSPLCGLFIRFSVIVILADAPRPVPKQSGQDRSCPLNRDVWIRTERCIPGGRPESEWETNRYKWPDGVGPEWLTDWQVQQDPSPPPRRHSHRSLSRGYCVKTCVLFRSPATAPVDIFAPPSDG